MRTLILIALAGFAAQLVDGGIGMGFGVTSTTVLLLAGLGPAQASAIVHASELGTTLVSGASHWRFGNVHWPTVVRLGVPGGIAAFLGATVLSRISTDAAAPVTGAILTAIGCNLIWRFSRGRVRRDPQAGRMHSTPFLIGLGSVGGFVDATGGGGWGPVSTSTLMVIGREQPRRIVGTVSASEFLVTLGATLGFVLGLWDDLVAHAAAVAALLVGGVIAAPIAAWLISRINPVALGGLVGTAIVVLNVPKVVDVPAWVLVTLGVVGVTLTVRGTLAYRAARKEADTADLHGATVEPAADEGDDDAAREGDDDAAREGEDDAAREGASASAREYAYSPATSPMT